MTQEEKAKAYDKAIEELRGLLEGVHEEKCEIMEEDIIKIFPELIESEDERTRKEILEYFQQFENGELRGVDITSWIAWLENQGEQKPADKIEPKFHEGDMIIHKELGGDYIHNPHKIIQVDILDKKYRLEGGLVAHFSEQEDYELVEQKPAWSEEDEKMLNDAIGAIGIADYYTYDYKQEIENWLKSLKDRYTWKPSDEQMDALQYVYRNCNPLPSDKLGWDSIRTLESLYQDLKKLRGE